MDDHWHAVGVVGAVEGEAVAERDAVFVEIVAMVGGDDDDGVVLELVACECGEDFCHAIVELAGAAVVERADLIDLRRWQGFPF